MIDRVAELLGYTFRNESLLTEALTHASSADSRLASNERLEFLGDAVLGLVVCEYLFHTHPDLLEGEMTKIKSAVVSRRVCASISQQIGLESLLNLGKGMSGRPALPSSIAAAVFESIIAAIYLDAGMDEAKAFILRHMEPFLRDAAASAHQHNFKSVLQQYAQRHLPCNPEYVVMDEKGPDHSKCFEVAVEVDGRRFTSAWAKSKKEAEQQAALNALREMDVAEVDDASGLITLRPIASAPRVRNGDPPVEPADAPTEREATA